MPPESQLVSMPMIALLPLLIDGSLLRRRPDEAYMGDMERDATAVALIM